MDSHKASEKEKVEKVSERALEQRKSEDRKTQSKIANRLLKVLFSSLSGLISIYPYFVMVAEADIMSEIYFNKNYAFFVLIPIYSPIPVTLLLTKFISRYRISSAAKISLTLILRAASFTAIPVVSLYLDSSKYSVYYSMLGCYFLSNIFEMMFQGYVMSVLSVYDSKWTAMYVSVQAIANLVIVSQKGISTFAGFNFKLDFLMVWGTFLLMSALNLVFFWRLVSTTEYQKKFSHEYSQTRCSEDISERKKQGGGSEGVEENPELEPIAKEPTNPQDLSQELTQPKKQSINYKKAFKAVKGDVLGVILMNTTYLLVFPGIVFSFKSDPIFPQQNYILYINTIIAVIDPLMRPFGIKKWARVVVKISGYLIVIADFVLIYFYFSNSIDKQKGLIYVVLVLMALIIARLSLSKSYFLIHSNQVADEETKEAIGSIMINAIQIGTALANIGSNGLLFLKVMSSGSGDRARLR